MQPLFFVYFLLSVFNPDKNYQMEVSKASLLEEKLFQYEKAIINKKNKHRLACHLAIEYQNQNAFKRSKKHVKSCRRLGKEYRELYWFLQLRASYYLNEKQALSKMNVFLKNYEESLFYDEVERMKLRYYFKHKKYKSAYYGYLKYKREHTLSHEHLRFVDYMLRYAYYEIADKKNKLLATLETLQDPSFYLKQTLKERRAWIEKVDLKAFKAVVTEYIKKKKYYNVSRLLYLYRQHFPKQFKAFLANQDVQNLLKNKDTVLNYKMNLYHDQKKAWGFEKSEAFLDELLNTYKEEQAQKDILYQKLVLYKNYKKAEKRIATYKKMLQFKLTRKRKAYYYLKIGVYSLDLGKDKQGLEYLNKLIKKYNRWYREYGSAVFVLFKYYRQKFLLEKDEDKKKEYLEKLAFFEKKIERTYLKRISYYYKVKDKRADKKEMKKIENYFSKRPYDFYSLILNKQTLTTKDAWKSWKSMTAFKALPKVDEQLKDKVSSYYSIKKILQIFKPHEALFPEIKIIKNLKSLGEVQLLENTMIAFYQRLYRLNKLKRKRKVKEEHVEFVKALKSIEKNYYFHFLNYFIAQNHIQYAYLMMHRHFNHLKNDPFYQYYYRPIPYREHIEREAKFFKINPFIVISIMETESIFNPNAYSSAGAIGLMQIMPATGRAIAKNLGVKEYNLYLPEFNIKFGTYYLSELLKRFEYQLPFSSASYNGGPHNMKRWLKANEAKHPDLDEMVEEIGFRESRNYAKKIVRLYFNYYELYFKKKLKLPMEISFSDNKNINF